MGDPQFLFNYDRSLFSTWKRNEELASYRTYYAQSDFSAGIRTPSRFSLGLHHSRLSGSAENLGSHRELFGLDLGYALPLWKGIFFQGSLIPGYALNQANFGKGVPLDTFGSLNLKAKGLLGWEHCFASLACPGVYLTGAGEWSLAGKTPYSILSGGIGVMISGTFGVIKTESSMAAASASNKELALEEIKAPELDLSDNIDSNELSKSNQEALQHFSLQLSRNPNKVFLIEAHCTLFQEPQKNRLEAYRLALVVRNYLVGTLNSSILQVRIDASEHSTERKGEVVDGHGSSIGQDRARPGENSRKWVTFREIRP